ncbi:hypothetical protein PVT68_17190 [Microbulbifer bruguierae]|uniref:EF-hand domain-containing protein n=1 Tax=Microbulbifer bruguierae TaxID=3029061 RepID=A0ABY8NC39_9GAMM|nr:hypothetical protein [Microbulbifer bruguierae]WGL16484.1 hypothetical protein PVT68_17190 [Microbulbifer bruguierae]
MNSLAIPDTWRKDWVSLLSLLVIVLTLSVILWTLIANQTDGRTTESDTSIQKQEISRTTAVPATVEREGTALLEASGYSEQAAEEVLAVKSVDLLGISIQLRELHAGAAGDGPIRNIEFFIRDGILPRRLFSNNTQIVTGYWPLYHNNVGYGATTVRILYQLLDQDTNGDGKLTEEDRKSLAFSLPDGSGYRMLDRDTGEIIDMTYLSDFGELQLEFLREDDVHKRVYSLVDAPVETHR